MHRRHLPGPCMARRVRLCKRRFNEGQHFPWRTVISALHRSLSDHVYLLCMAHQEGYIHFGSMLACRTSCCRIKYRIGICMPQTIRRAGTSLAVQEDKIVHFSLDSYLTALWPILQYGFRVVEVLYCRQQQLRSSLCITPSAFHHP